MVSAASPKTAPNIQTGIGVFTKKYNFHRQKQKQQQPQPQPPAQVEKIGFWARFFGVKSKTEQASNAHQPKKKLKASKPDDKTMEDRIEKLVNRAATDSARLRMHFSISKLNLKEKADPLTARIWVMKAILLPAFRTHRFSGIFLKFDENNPVNYEYLAQIFLDSLTGLHHAKELSHTENLNLQQALKDVFGSQFYQKLLDAMRQHVRITITDKTTVKDAIDNKVTK